MRRSEPDVPLGEELRPLCLRGYRMALLWSGSIEVAERLATESAANLAGLMRRESLSRPAPLVYHAMLLCGLCALGTVPADVDAEREEPRSLRAQAGHFSRLGLLSRMALSLAIAAELPIHEIAELLGRPASDVLAAMHEGRDQLARHSNRLRREESAAPE